MQNIPKETLETQKSVNKRLPDFLIVGSMKSGTTTLYEYLCRHPNIFMCTPKEPMFFSHEEQYSQGLNWYCGQFESAQPHQLCGEASQSYSRWPHYPDVPQRIFEVMPQAKLIYLMRHPVDRVYSHYTHCMQEYQIEGKPVISFEEALATNKEYVDTSNYIQQIQKFLSYFPKEQLFLMIADDFQKNPSDSLKQVQKFLGLEVKDLVGESQLRANPTNGSLVAHETISDRVMHLRRGPLVSWLVKLIPGPWREKTRRTFVKVLAHSIVGRKMAANYREAWSPFLPETRKRLLKEFESPTRELELFLGRKLSSWYE